MTDKNKKDMRNIVRESYGKIADNRENSEGCCDGDAKCSQEVTGSIGYSEDEVLNIPKEADMGLGCGNPQLIAQLKEGETVIDLGSGGGIDCFLAANKVGDEGFVIGVDMTTQMVSKARSLATEHGYQNVDFRLGEIENLPVADCIADVVISNCVINLSSQKQRVYHEAYRVLKEGGRIAISDIVLMKEPTEAMKQDEKLYCG